MKVQDVITNIKTAILPNVTNVKQMSQESLVRYINEGLRALHSLFIINKEQAIILVPAFRHTFRISSEDPNVVMNTLSKLAKCELEYGDIPTKALQIEVLREYNHIMNSETMLEKEQVNETIFKVPDEGILKILGVVDDQETDYLINERNVFMVDQTTMYFPNCAEGMIIYVEYQLKPKEVSLDKLSDEIDLPDTLLESLYAYINLKVLSGIESNRQFYPNLLNTYNQTIQEARANQAVLPSGMSSSLQNKKGFY